MARSKPKQDENKLDNYMGKVVEFEDEGEVLSGTVVSVDNSVEEIEVDCGDPSATYWIKEDEITRVVEEDVTGADADGLEAEEGAEAEEAPEEKVEKPVVKKGKKAAPAPAPTPAPKKEKPTVAPKAKPEKKGKDSITIDDLTGMDKVALKAFAKEQGIKLPVYEYAKEDKLRAGIARELGLSDAKPTTKKPSAAKKEEPVAEEAPAKRVSSRKGRKNSGKGKYIAELIVEKKMYDRDKIAEMTVKKFPQEDLAKTKQYVSTFIFCGKLFGIVPE